MARAPPPREIAGQSSALGSVTLADLDHDAGLAAPGSIEGPNVPQIAAFGFASPQIRALQVSYFARAGEGFTSLQISHIGISVDPIEALPEPASLGLAALALAALRRRAG